MAAVPPELEFAVEEVGAAPFAAVPTLLFALRVDANGADVRALSLNVQVRIDAARRSYREGDDARLLEIFGRPEAWATTLRSLLWTQASLAVPGFAGETVVELPVACTYDFDVVAAKYLHALDAGDVPLELLFSGTAFYPGDDGRLQAAPVPWSSEAKARLPVRVWREAVDHAFPGTAWLRVARDTFERLSEFRNARTLPRWDAALAELLEGRS
ncbi:MAG TPA: DUF6084 family protein [Actinomycetota bacterium]|nr:DUF6084 family protein [Actinomycetota bacterium]